LIVTGFFLGARLVHSSQVAGAAGADGVWSTFRPVAVGARPRQAAAYDPVRDRVVVFGGTDPADVDVSPVAALSLAGDPFWSEIRPGDPSPEPRTLSARVYDPPRAECLGARSPGFYFVRIIQGKRSSSARVVVVD